MISEKFTVMDTTFREGLQSPVLHDIHTYPLSGDIAVLARALMLYGVKSIETFSPIVKGQNNKNISILKEVRSELEIEPQTIAILAHCRCDNEDIDAALKAGADGLNLFLRTSDRSRGVNHGLTLKDVKKKARQTIEGIRRNHPNITLRFSGEDAFRTKPEDLFVVYDEIADLVDRLGTPDTVGVAKPIDVTKRVILLKERYPKVALEGHFHNDRGLAIANSLAAVEAGIDLIDTSVLGLGERSGITSFTGLLFNLCLDDQNFISRFDIGSSYGLNILFSDILHIQVPPTEPVSLTNRTHVAGVHTRQIIGFDQGYYEGNLGMLEKFGVSENRILLGPLTGWHTVHYYLSQILDFRNVTVELAKAITDEFKERASELTPDFTPTNLLTQIALKHNLEQITHENEPLINL